MTPTVTADPEHRSPAKPVIQGLDEIPRPGGVFRGLDRWFRPERFADWGDGTPDRYLLRLPLLPSLVLTCSPEDCRAIFTEREGTLQFGEGLRRLAPHEAMFGHDAIAALDGEDHGRFRRQLTAAFHGEALKGYESAIIAATRHRIARWPIGQPVAFASLMHDLARDVIAGTVLGVTDPTRSRRLAAVLERLDRAINSLELAGRFASAILLRGWWAPYPRMESIHAELATITRAEIAARRAAGDRSGRDCLGRFLNQDPSAPDTMTDDEIVAALRVLVVAGWATTANTLAWAAERLARHPAALVACEDDVRANGSRYLVATVQETLRMRPPVPVTVRYVARDFELNGLAIPKGTLVATDIERMHHRSDIYPDPFAFAPERFLENRPGTYTWIPFGGGVHRCIGAGFALTEARLILQTILRELTFVPERVPDESLSRRTLITAPGRGALVTLSSRTRP
ncbi:MAG: cytochrome P450 [Solirubrobacteraceae bacterium]